ncbi:hypothetical protein GUJ93_ZPchr0013g36500 [Zizania palustris]|uniref:Uncharacterized protein n=1 Tax=Zizania palustris TaxID=103762 RepID=A0A8J6BWT5_ZIZPA|nr:hypothetical protein GUJ93_ZPchr0013g36500 [Zizania palustris]
MQRRRSPVAQSRSVASGRRRPRRWPRRGALLRCGGGVGYGVAASGWSGGSGLRLARRFFTYDERDDRALEEEAEKKFGWILKIFFIGTAGLGGYQFFPYTSYMGMKNGGIKYVQVNLLACRVRYAARRHAMEGDGLVGAGVFAPARSSRLWGCGPCWAISGLLEARCYGWFWNPRCGPEKWGSAWGF